MHTIDTNGGFMLIDFINAMAAKGRSSFSYKDIEKQINLSSMAIKAALRRLQKKGDIVMPCRGFYVIVPPEYRALGSLPAEQFIPDLMNYLGEIYYVGLLSAAEYHGAAHQRSQIFQVVVAKSRRSIRCGKIRVDFIFRKNAAKIPTQNRNTPAGIINISTPEGTALDLIGYTKHCGGINNVATVLAELAEKIDSKRLVVAAKLSPIAWVQRLGYLLDLIIKGDKTEGIAAYIKNKLPVRIRLIPSNRIKGAKMDARWRVLINTKVEADI
jgi:predicted transcriptional regulator of viral defense system